MSRQGKSFQIDSCTSSDISVPAYKDKEGLMEIWIDKLCGQIAMHHLAKLYGQLHCAN
jgi:hypothetical protein